MRDMNDKKHKQSTIVGVTIGVAVIIISLFSIIFVLDSYTSI